MKAKKYWILGWTVAFCLLALLAASVFSSPKPDEALLKAFEKSVEQEIESLEERKKELKRMKHLAKDPNSIISILMKEDERATLRGLKGVAVRVSVIDYSRLSFITDSELKTLAERILRDEGIKVFETWTDVDIGQLFVQVEVDRSFLRQDGLSIRHFCVYTSLLQPVQLVRNPEIRIANQTWTPSLSPTSFVADSAGISGSVTIGQRIKNVVVLHAGDFADAFLAANPKETTNRLGDLIKPENQATEEIVFTGIPRIKIGSQGTPEKLSQAKSIEYKCTITKVGNKYYWATRENVELLLRQSGVYTTFIAVNGAGYIRITDPEMKKVVFEEGEQPYDYMEHLLLGLSTISYYGTSQ